MKKQKSQQKKLKKIIEKKKLCYDFVYNFVLFSVKFNYLYDSLKWHYILQHDEFAPF